MKSVRLGLVSLGALIPFLAGCGSSSDPPFSVSCRVQLVAGGQFRAAVTIINNTSTAGAATIYGPVFIKLRHFSPVTLHVGNVIVEDQHGKNKDFGLVIPNIRPNASRHVILRFDPPGRPQSIAVTNLSVVPATDSNPLDNPNCVIGQTGTPTS